MQFRGSVKRALYEELARRQDALCWANRFIPCSAASADMWSCTGKQVAPEANLRQDKRLAVGRLGALVEQIEALVSRDVQVILVRSPHHLASGAYLLLLCSMSKGCIPMRA